MMKENTSMVKRANEMIANQTITPKREITTNKKLRSSRIQTHNNAHNKKSTVRKEQRQTHEVS